MIRVRTDPAAARLRSEDWDENSFFFFFFLISNSPNQFSEKSGKKIHKPHTEIINEGIMLTNQYRRPARNLYRVLHKSASLFV